MKKITININPQELGEKKVTLGEILPPELKERGKRGELRKQLPLLKKAGEEGVYSPAIRIFYRKPGSLRASFVVAPHRFVRGHLFVSLPSMRGRAWTVRELDHLLDYVQVVDWRWV